MISANPAPGGLARVCPDFVGREDLLALADRRWQKALEGSGHVLLLGGEAGIGKSRLLDEIVEELGASRSVQVSAFPSDRETPGVLLLELAGELRGAGEGDAAARIRELVLDDGALGDSSRRRRLLVAELTSVLHDVLATSMLLRVEDVHWADELSLEVLERVAGGLRAQPSMAILTYRSDELYPQSGFQLWRTRLLGQRRAEEVRLARLDEDGTARMFVSILGREPATDELERLYESSDGIPLHIEEVLAGGFDQVPDTIAEAVIDRTVRLRPRTRELLTAAAVLGRSFDADLLSRVTGDTPVEVELMLDELMAEHFVVARADGPTYDFRHALIRDAVYEDIGLARRRALHAAVAEAAEHDFTDAAVSAHFERAGLAAQAYARSLAAADHAIRLSAHREAAELLERAERTMPSATSPADRAELHRRLAAELGAIDDNEAAEREYVRAIELLRAQGDEVAAAELVPWLVSIRHLLGADLHARMGDLDDALDRLAALPEERTRSARTHLLAALAAATMLDRRLEDALEYGRRARELFTDGDLETRIGVDATIGSVLVFAGRSDEGWRILEEATTRAVGAGLEAAAARSYRMIGSSASMLGEYERAEAWLTEGIAYTERTERWNDHHYLVAHLGHVHWQTGDATSALAMASRALADGRCAITTRITALHVLGFVALSAGENERATELLDEAREIGDGMHELQRVSPALWGLAELAARTGHPAEAVELSERGYADSARVSDAAYLFPFVVTGTRAHLAVSGTAAARDWLDRCTALLELRQIPVTRAAVEHAEGLIELAEGRPAHARAALERATENWTAHDRWWERTQSVIDRAVCALRSKSPAAAAELLAEARGVATATDAPALLSQAIAAAAGAPRDEGTYPLTAREVEVARLVAIGSTNRQIASSLSIAPKTVGSHVEHILAKLGAARRAEIAAWSAAHPSHPAP